MNSTDNTQVFLAAIDNLNVIIREKDDEIRQLKETIVELDKEIRLAYDNH